MKEIDWNSLKKLRQAYLGASGSLPDYWQDEALLEAYEATLGARIAWKWDAVLDAFEGRAFASDAEPMEISQLIDWGCGTGVAARRFLARGRVRCKKVSFYDRSSRASGYAQRMLRMDFPQQPSEALLLPPAPAADSIILISHVISELSEEERRALAQYASRAAIVIWVEAGRQQESRVLSALRETWRPTHRFLAPCPHDQPCGMLAAEQRANWCHFFAPVPSAAFQSAFWRQASRELGIDLRSLPLSYVIAARRQGTPEQGESQLAVLGRARSYKGYCRWTACSARGILEGNYLKRRSRALYEQLAAPGVDMLIDSQQLLEIKE